MGVEIFKHDCGSRWEVQKKAENSLQGEKMCDGGAWLGHISWEPEGRPSSEQSEVTLAWTSFHPYHLAGKKGFV